MNRAWESKTPLFRFDVSVNTSANNISRVSDFRAAVKNRATRAPFDSIIPAILLQEIDPEKQDVSAGGDCDDPKINHSEVRCSDKRRMHLLQIHRNTVSLAPDDESATR